jgi:hypothetical protein
MKRNKERLLRQIKQKQRLAADKRRGRLKRERDCTVQEKADDLMAV